MLRLSAKSLALGAGLVLLAHGVVLARESAPPTPSAIALVSVIPLLAYLIAGRIALSLLPPGEVGSHSWRDLPVTVAASLVLGSLLAGFVPLVWSVGIALGLGLLRGLALPGTMVPRHRPPGEPCRALDGLVALALSAWAAYLVFVQEYALLWLALFVLLFHGLTVARRRRAGGYAILALGAALCPHGLFSALTPALGLGMGACFLIPWLRRADRRAGVLAMLGFGGVFADGPSLLALVGPAVLLSFSHVSQRRFAAVGVLFSSLTFLALGALAGLARPARGRLLWLPELVSSALDWSVWGLAWPAVAAALVLGAVAFDWRGPSWTVGTIETPRREAQALLVLVVLSAAALAPPFAPWAEEEVLVLIFPLCALLAGLLVIPAERNPSSS